MAQSEILRVEDLVVEYRVGRQWVRAVDRVSFSLGRGEIVGLVGESGCGKTTLGNALLRLIAKPHRIASGRLYYGEMGDVLQFNPMRLHRYRWGEVAVIFQSAQSALNPLLTIFEQACLVMQSHRDISRSAIRQRVEELLGMVNLDPSRAMDAYPHELSGGMKQRVGIAMALLLEPQLLVLDEPTTALDVMSQATVLEILQEVHQRLHTAMLFITHDMSVIAELADRVVVMYAGRVAEMGPVNSIFYQPQHPYTKALMAAVPSLRGDPRTLAAIAGHPPDLLTLAGGCRYADRCTEVIAPCRVGEPELRGVGFDHLAACIRVVGNEPEEVHS